MARKIFISFLGTTNYVETIYKFEDGEISPPTRFVQIALLEKLTRNWSSDDRIFIFSTNDATKSNWLNDGHLYISEEVEKAGLLECLSELNLPTSPELIPISEGFTNNEIWDIFEVIYSKLEPNDDVYFDITHAFRSIPIFSSTLLNYARLIKKINVKGIFYGAFEYLGPARKVKEKPIEERVAPILNLNEIEVLRQWTQAAQMLIDTGATKYLNDILNQDDSSSLNNFVLEISEVRSNDIISGKNVTDIKKLLEAMTINNSPFEEVKDIILSTISGFKEDNLENIYEAVKYCYKYNLITQGLTLLTELVISKVLCEVGYSKKEDINTLQYRNAVSSSLSINKKEKFDFSKFHKENEELDENIIVIVDRVYALEDKKKTTKFYSSLSHGARNDIAHAGFRNNPKSVGYFKDKLKEYMAIYESLFNLKTETKLSTAVYQPPLLLINLTNHPFEQWDEKQKEASLQFGSCIDMPFPAIDPTADEEEIENIAEEYLQKITTLAEEKNAQPVVHLMGEMTFMHNLANKLKENDIRCIASTSKRISNDLGNGQKQIDFQFVRFRDFY